MTTIAYKAGVIAADSRCTEGNHIIPGKMRKLHELPDGSIYTFTGSVAHGMAMLDALLNGTKQPTWELGDTLAVRVMPTGRVLIYEGEGVWFEQTSKIAAWGSGAEFAYGAMEAGATAAEAVRIAIKHDSASGGPVRTIQVKKPRKRSRE